MTYLLDRFKAKLKEIYYETPIPNLIKKLEPKEPEDKEDTDNEPDDVVLPEDFRDIKTEKFNKVYNLKLKDIPPHQWMQVGTSLINMAYEDPDYGREPCDDPMTEEPLPPPPEQSEYIKNLTGPLISLNLKDLNWVDLEEVGEVFYDMGKHHQKKYDMDDYESLPQEWNRCDDLDTSDEEDIEEELFDPLTRIKDEMTEVKKLTNSDVIPGLEKVPWKDDDEAWLESSEPDPPPWDNGRDDYITEGKLFPIHSRMFD